MVRAFRVGSFSKRAFLRDRLGNEEWVVIDRLSKALRSIQTHAVHARHTFTQQNRASTERSLLTHPLHPPIIPDLICRCHIIISSHQ